MYRYREREEQIIKFLKDRGLVDDSISVVRYRGELLPGRFNTVLCIDMIEHFSAKDRGAIVGEVVSSLCDGGRAFIACPTKVSGAGGVPGTLSYSVGVTLEYPVIRRAGTYIVYYIYKVWGAITA